MLLSSAQRLEPTDRLQLSFAMPQAEQCLLVDHAARFDDESESGSNDGINRRDDSNGLCLELLAVKPD